MKAIVAPAVVLAFALVLPLSAADDDRLELLPAGKPCRVRGIQVYHRDAIEAAAGHRAALNLADLDWHAVGRGDVLAEPGLFRASTLFDVRFRRSPGGFPCRPCVFPFRPGGFSRSTRVVARGQPCRCRLHRPAGRVAARGDRERRDGALRRVARRWHDLAR